MKEGTARDGVKEWVGYARGHRLATDTRSRADATPSISSAKCISFRVWGKGGINEERGRNLQYVLATI